MDFVHKVQQTIVEERLIEKENTIIVAVSGGPDSVALLHVLHELSSEWNLKIVISHVNHQFRGEESDLESEKVQQLAEELGWPCEVGVINVPEYIQLHSLNTQAAAREKRYEFLIQTAHQYDANKIALAHHADDQAETILMRLVRGTGPSGLSGIPIRRIEQQVELIRPFLRIYKSDLLDYCEQKSINYSHDSSNQERKYTRNQVRLDMLPYLQQWNAQLPQSLNKLSLLMKDEDDFIDFETNKWFDQWVERDCEQCVFSKNAYVSIPIALQRRLIKLILSYLSPKSEACDFIKVEMIRSAVLQNTTPSMELHIFEQISFSMEYDRIRIGQNKDVFVGEYAYKIEGFPVKQQIPEASVTIIMEERDLTDEVVHSIQRGDKNQVVFDRGEIALPLWVRNRRQGDRIKVFGLKGTKKVKDIFMDEKIPPSQRELIPMIVDADNHVLWIPGIRHSERAAVTNRTIEVLHMSWDKFI